MEIVSKTFFMNIAPAFNPQCNANRTLQLFGEPSYWPALESYYSMSGMDTGGYTLYNADINTGNHCNVPPLICSLCQKNEAHTEDRKSKRKRHMCFACVRKYHELIWVVPLTGTSRLVAQTGIHTSSTCHVTICPCIVMK